MSVNLISSTTNNLYDSSSKALASLTSYPYQGDTMFPFFPTARKKRH